MRVLLITQMYAPEMGAPTSRLTTLMKGLQRAGHEVVVATGMPNYPAGKVYDGYRGKWLMKDSVDGVDVIRTHYYTCPRNQSKWKQLFSYLSFLPAVFLSGLRAGKIDAVVVSSPPIFPILVGIMLSFLRRARLIFDLRDLWPDEIVACGGAGANSLPVKVIGWIERTGYRCSDQIFCTTESFKQRILKRGAREEQISLVPNGADTSLFQPQPKNRDAVRREYELGDKFVIMYCGAIGLKHGLPIVIEAADRLREHTDLEFAFVGDGAARKQLEETVREKGLTNVRFLGKHNLDQIPRVLSAADLCITSLQPEEYLKSILAVKVFEYMACEKPVVASLAGETAQVIERANSGIVTAPGDVEALAQAIETLANDPELAAKLGANGPPFVAEHFSRFAIADHFAAELERGVGIAKPSESVEASSDVSDQERVQI